MTDQQKPDEGIGATVLFFSALAIVLIVGGILIAAQYAPTQPSPPPTAAEREGAWNAFTSIAALLATMLGSS